MKLLISILPALLCSCGTVATADRVSVRSNCSYVEWHGGRNPSLVMRDVNNAVPTRAAGSVIGTAFSGLAAALTAYLSGGLAR